MSLSLTKFDDLGSSLSWDNDCGKKIRKIIAKVLGAMAGFKNVWTSKETVMKQNLTF